MQNQLCNYAISFEAIICRQSRGSGRSVSENNKPTAHTVSNSSPRRSPKSTFTMVANGSLALSILIVGVGMATVALSDVAASTPAPCLSLHRSAQTILLIFKTQRWDSAASVIRQQGVLALSRKKPEKTIEKPHRRRCSGFALGTT